MIAEPMIEAVRLRASHDGTFVAIQGFSAEIKVDGPLVESQLNLGFVNDTGQNIEGDLVFPLPPSAALTELTVLCGSRTLQGKIRPRGRAQAEYRRAVEAGQTAALAQSEGEDLMQLHIAPIEAGEQVIVKLGLMSVLTPTAEGHRLLVPLTYMPRFVEDATSQKAIEAAAGERPRPATLAARATVRITIKHSAGLEAPTIRCSSHTALQERLADRTVVTVQSVPLDRDLHLEIADKPKKGQPAIWTRYQSGEGPDGLGATTSVALIPPAFADEGPTIPRTVTLLVDRSGSMSGNPMAAAQRAVRGCLRALGPSDRFNIIAFDSSLEALARRPVPFNDQNLQAADAFISAITARGGTDATMAMKAALDDVQVAGCSAVIESVPRPDAAHRLRIVVFMTDGDVSGAQHILEVSKPRLADTRLHVIGIGASVQHSLLGALATLGGGTYTPVSDDKDLEKALTRLKNTIDAPLMTGIQVTTEIDGVQQSPKHLEPQGPLDLFAGRPLLLSWRGNMPATAKLLLTGLRPDGEELRLRVSLDLDKAAEDGRSAALLWALLRNRRLTYRFDSSDDATLQALGTDFGLVNRQVALVAVHPEQRDVEVESTRPVSLPMPSQQAPATSGGASYNTTSAGSYQGGSPFPPPAPAAPMRPSVAAPAKAKRRSAPAPMSPPAPGSAPPAVGASAPARSNSAKAQLRMEESAATPSPAAAQMDFMEMEMERAAPAPVSASYSPPSAGHGAIPSMPADLSMPEEAPSAPKGGLLSRAKELFSRKPKADAKRRSSSSTPVSPPPEMSAPPPPPPPMAPAALPVSVAPKPAPKAAKDEGSKAEAKAAVSRRFSDNEAGLRALLLEQGADGLFAGDWAVTLAAVAALVSRGHTAREGQFRAELRRTLQVVRQQLPGLSGGDRHAAALTLALLTVPHGEAAPAELVASAASAVADASLHDLAALRAKTVAALAALQTEGATNLTTQPLAHAILQSFQLLP